MFNDKRFEAIAACRETSRPFRTIINRGGKVCLRAKRSVSLHADSVVSFDGHYHSKCTSVCGDVNVLVDETINLITLMFTL
jgi:hypothetical protein